MTRDWTEAEARAWLRASLPKGWVVSTRPRSSYEYARATMRHRDGLYCEKLHFTLRSACRALIRAAKRAGIAVNQVQEPGGKS